MNLTAIQSRQFGSVLTTAWDNSDLKGKHYELRDLIKHVYTEQITKPDILKQEVLQGMLYSKISTFDAETVTKIQTLVTIAFGSANAIREYRFETTGKSEWFLTAETAKKAFTEKDKGDFKNIISKEVNASLRDKFEKILDTTIRNISSLDWGTLAQVMRNEIDYLCKAEASKKEALIETIKLFNKILEKDLPKEPVAAATDTATPSPQELDSFKHKFIEMLISKAPKEMHKKILSNLGKQHLQRALDSTYYDKILMIFEANIHNHKYIEKFIPLFIEILGNFKSQDVPNFHDRDVAVQQACAIIKELYPQAIVPTTLEAVAVAEKALEHKPPVENMISICAAKNKMEAFQELKPVILNDFIEAMISSAPEGIREDIRIRLDNMDHEGRGKTTNEVIVRFTLALESSNDLIDLKKEFEKQMDEYCYHDNEFCKIRTPASDAGIAILKRINQSYMLSS